MLENATVVATVAVKDLATSKQFYGQTLGLNQTDESPAGVMYSSGGGSQLFMYEAPSAGTGQATSASWKVNNIEDVVADLKSKGVTFEHYDMPGATLEGDIHVWDTMKSAWFKDPSGNILCVANG